MLPSIVINPALLFDFDFGIVGIAYLRKWDILMDK